MKSGRAEEGETWGLWQSGKAGERHRRLSCVGTQLQGDWSLAETHPKTAITSST